MVLVDDLLDDRQAEAGAVLLAAVANSSNSRPSISAGMPAPVSANSSTSLVVRRRRVPMRNVPAASASPAPALRARLWTTRMIFCSSK